MTEGRWRRFLVTAAIVCTAYAALACALTWPLPMHLRTHLLGDPTGDTGVYVWNVWIFRHELLRHGRLPFSTEHVFSFTGGADFTLHNYTPIAGLLGLLLIEPFGVVGAFNIVLLLALTLAGVSVFALARRLGLSAATAWFAGALFMASPVLTARETAHLSLVTAAPLPLFVLALVRALDSKTRRDAVLVGLVVALATYSDAYYGPYCVLMGAFLIASRFARLKYLGRPANRSGERLLDAVIVLLLAVLGWRAFSGSSVAAIGPLKIGLATAYTPALLLSAAVATRWWLAKRPVVTITDPAREVPVLFRRAILSVTVCLAVLAPLLIGIAMRYAIGRMPETPIYWRSSPRGVDLFSYFVPNPNHPWFGARTRDWFMPPLPDAFPEYVGSFSLVAFVLIVLAARRGALPRLWIAFSALFAALSLGPFVHIGGVNTYVTGPWALLRYMPVVGMARSPARFAIVATLGFSLLAGFALDGLRRQYPNAMRAGVPLLLALVVFELTASPRPLFSARVPDVYQSIATSDDEVGRLLELPTGIRDGTSSLGNFNASAEFFQTQHRRPLIGGYISRVSEWRKRENDRVPMLHALFSLSEGQTPPLEWLEKARRSREAFLSRGCVRYVIIDKTRASRDLQDFAVDALRLRLLRDDGARALYEPVDPPQCRTAPSTIAAR